MTSIGFVHPGAMGASLAASCGAECLWASDGRSAESRARAVAAGIEDVGTLAALCERSDIVVSICPPGAALDVSAAVAELGFDGIYVDANAIAPATATTIAGRHERFVDGGVVGPPVSGPGSTRLYLSGEDADVVASAWSDSDLDVRVVDGGAGAASAVKVAYAAWTKGSSALLLAVRAYAEAAGVADTLVDEWNLSLPGLAADAERRAAGVGPKAWRWVGEMEEISAAFEHERLPGGFHAAAAELYERLAEFRGVGSGPELDAVMTAILRDARG